MTQHHMSVSKQEAEFLKCILAKHLDDVVEVLVREDKTDNAMKHMQEKPPIKELVQTIQHIKYLGLWPRILPTH